MDRDMLPGQMRFMIFAVSCLLAAVGSGTLASAAGAVGFEFEGAFGPDGSSSTGFTKAGPVAVDNLDDVVYVLDLEAKTLFKFDLEGNPVNFGGSSPDVSGNELKNLSVGEGLGPRQIAVNPNTGNIYLTGGYEPVSEKATALEAFEADGDPISFTAGPGEGTNSIGGFPNLRGVAVDGNGAIYLSGTEADEFGIFSNHVSIYSESGALLVASVDEQLQSPANLAVDGNGNLYATQNLSEATRYTPSEFPVTASTTYARASELVDPKPAQSVSVDPASNRVYVLETTFEEGNAVSRVRAFNEEGGLEGSFAGPGEAGELSRPYGIAVADVGEFTDDGDIAKVFVSDNPEGGLAQVKVFREEITIAAPTVESTAAAAITGDSATLRAKINPNNRETTYWFEYGESDCAVSTCTKVPLAGGSIGSGRKGVVVTQSVSGLLSGVTYHFRVVAKNEKGKTEGPDETFTTQGSGLGFLLGDSRVWEMVSPANKFNGEVVADDTSIVEASASGEGIAYASLGSLLADPQGSRSIQPTTVLSHRGNAGGWASEDLSPPHTEATVVSGDSEFKAFTANLERAVMEPVDETPLSPQATEQTPYQWNDGVPPVFSPLVVPGNVAPGTAFGPKNSGAETPKPITIEAASPDLAHVALNSEVPLLDNAPKSAVYLWSGGNLEAVSELPEGGPVVQGQIGSGHGSVRHAVSNDGTRVFWAPAPGYDESGINLPALYLWDTVAGQSVRLDIPQSGATKEGAENPAFNIANADGSVVFFTDSQQLTVGASPSGRDLYRCEVGPVEDGLGCAHLTDLSAPLEGSGESAEVLDQVSGASEDGTTLYFVARGVLDEAPNNEGEAAGAGEPNLYRWQQGHGVRYIATLSTQDSLVWGSRPGNVGFAELISAQASPSGRFFTFTSDQSLTGYENRNDSDQPTTEAFLYDADTSGLTCISCNPTGAAAVGQRLTNKVNFPPAPTPIWKGRWMAATLPAASRTGNNRSLYRPRAILDNGRVFFNSVDPLVPADTNGNWDVYEYEPLGLGSCAATTASASETRSGVGCVALVSSGTAEGDAGFLDASSGGNDVFFLTQGRLSALDHDAEVDVYDARVDGIQATLPSMSECLGETCQAPATAPNEQAPGSASFSGQGNVRSKAPKHCPKGKRKVRRHGKARCVPKRHKKKQHHKAGKSRGAGR
jgi:hypothetical protein